MGAWDYGSFDNDDAGDWVWELEEAGSLVPVVAAIEAVENGGGYLEAPVCSIAIAAAEVVAAIFGKPSTTLPESLKPVVAALEGTAEPSLKSRAAAAVLRVKTDSELKELWDDAGATAEWHRHVDDLLLRLQ